MRKEELFAQSAQDSNYKSNIIIEETLTADVKMALAAASKLSNKRVRINVIHYSHVSSLFGALSVNFLLIKIKWA